MHCTTIWQRPVAPVDRVMEGSWPLALIHRGEHVVVPDHVSAFTIISNLSTSQQHCSCGPGTYNNFFPEGQVVYGRQPPMPETVCGNDALILPRFSISLCSLATSRAGHWRGEGKVWGQRQRVTQTRGCGTPMR